MKLTNKIKERLYLTPLSQWTEEELYKMRRSFHTGADLLFCIVREQDKRGLLKYGYKGSLFYPPEKIKP